MAECYPLKPSVLAQLSQGPVRGQDEWLEFDSNNESNTSTEAQEDAKRVTPPIVSVPPSPPVPPPVPDAISGTPALPPPPTQPRKLLCPASIRLQSSFPENQSVSEDLLIGTPRIGIGIVIDL